MIRDRSFIALLAGEYVSRLRLHQTDAVMAVLGTFATLNFILAVAPMRGHVAQEAA